MARTVSSGDQATLGIAARIDRLPRSVHLLGLVARIAGGGWLEFYELAMPAYISLGLIGAGIYTKQSTGPLDGLFDPKSYATFLASFYVGMFIGTMALGKVSDRFGRKAAFTVPMIGYATATLLVAASSSPLLIDTFRLIAGIGVGIQLINNDAYISELTPQRLRGRYIATALLISFTSYPVAALLGYAFVPHQPLGIAGWRWVVIIGGALGFLVLLLRRGLTESPRWLASRGRTAEAERALSAIEARVERETGAPLPEPVPASADGISRKGSWTEMFRGKYLRRTTMMSVFQFTQTISVYGFTSWVPILLIDKGITVVSSLQYTFEIAILTPFGGLLAILLAERFERKWQLVFCGVEIAVVGLVFAQMHNVVGIVIVGGLVTLGNYWMIGIFHTYNAELFPTRIRSQAVSFNFSWSRVSSIFVGYMVSGLLSAYGTNGVFALIVGAMAVLTVFIATMGPRTNGQRLETLAS
ncbi:MAG: MFS transporter [Nocardiopsaceae bacterium]|nr:MFS transporter [Nocardiopsaceae bacterium]